MCLYLQSFSYVSVVIVWIIRLQFLEAGEWIPSLSPLPGWFWCLCDLLSALYWDLFLWAQ